MSPIRCFVAASLPREVRESLRALQERLRQAGLDARWAPTDSMHLTLKFIGEVDETTFGQLAAVLGEPVAAGGGLRLAPQGVGAFPSPGRARVLWAGLGGDVAPLARAVLELEARLEPLGIPRERRPFRAHLTLARARGPAGIRGAGPALEREADYAGPGFGVTELILFESRLRPQGAEHVPRAAVPLG